MRTWEKGVACHVVHGQASGVTGISVADPDPLRRVMENLKANGLEATTERYGVLWFLRTEASWEKLPDILLDHFKTYYCYEDPGTTQVQITDADGNVELDDREDWLDDAGSNLG